MSRGVNVGCILRALTAERVGLVIAKKEISKENENSVCLNEKNVIWKTVLVYKGDNDIRNKDKEGIKRKGSRFYEDVIR